MDKWRISDKLIGGYPTTALGRGELAVVGLHGEFWVASDTELGYVVYGSPRAAKQAQALGGVTDDRFIGNDDVVGRAPVALIRELATILKIHPTSARMTFANNLRVGQTHLKKT